MHDNKKGGYKDLLEELDSDLDGDPIIGPRHPHAKQAQKTRAPSSNRGKTASKETTSKGADRQK